MVNSDFLSTVPAFIGATAGLGALLWSVWSTLHEHARRMLIGDLATKRVAFWEHFLNVAVTTTAIDSDERKESKAEAYRAIERVRSDADRDLQRRSWKSATWEQFWHQHSTFSQRFKFLLLPGERLRPNAWLLWCLYIVFFSIFVLLALCAVGLLIDFGRTRPGHPGNVPFLPYVVGVVSTICLLYLASESRKAAEGLKHPRPEFKIIDQI